MHNSVARFLIYTTVVFSACTVPLHGGVDAHGQQRCSVIVKACLAGVKEIAETCEQAVRPEHKKTSFGSVNIPSRAAKTYVQNPAHTLRCVTGTINSAVWLLHKSSIELLI